MENPGKGLWFRQLPRKKVIVLKGRKRFSVTELMHRSALELLMRASEFKKLQPASARERVFIVTETTRSRLRPSVRA
jgi:hypothetical protein